MTKSTVEADKVLIATTGRTPEPIVVSITEHAPDAVILIASEQSLDAASAVRKEYPELTYKTLILEDAESLVEAFRVARESLAIAKQWEAKTILTDISGGTKPMTAGVTLALAGMGVTISYVGGSKRDEKGRVVSGHERVRLLEDPTERFHLAAWENFKTSWNAWRMATAADALKRILADRDSLSRSEQRFYGGLERIAAAMAAWDRFHHQEALSVLKKHLPIALVIAEAWGHRSKVRVLMQLEAQLDHLERIANQAGKPTRNLLTDLLANADRRAEAGRYDDAVARLYRAVELAAESDLFERTGLQLKKPSTWPQSVPDDFRERAEGARGLFDVLDLIFDLDLQLGQQGTLAQQIRSELQSLRPVLGRRNESILAHGARPVTEEDYREFRQYFTKLGLEAAQPWPRW